MKRNYRLIVSQAALLGCSTLLHANVASAQTPDAAKPAEAGASVKTEVQMGDAQPAAAGAETDAPALTPTPPEPLPPEGLPLPVYVPPAEAAPAPGSEPTTATTTKAEAPSGDEIKYSGYLPGYRRHFGFGSGPVQPTTGALPGGMTPGFAAPIPPNEWQFSFNGYASLSAQVSIDQRAQPEDGQSTTVTHVLPQTIDSYMQFTSTNAVPGNWVNLRFKYGTSRVSANVSVDTYNPTAPTTFYQMGSQFFVNNAYLSWLPSPIGAMSFQVDVGRMGISHGQLSRYGNGLYTNLVSALIQGNGLRAQAWYDLNPDWQLVGEMSSMMPADGTLPFNTVRSQENGWRRRMWAGSLINAVHLGFNTGKEWKYEFRLRYMSNRAYEDRLADSRFDDPTTRGINEKNLKDGAIDIYATDFKALNDVYGVIGVGLSYTDAANAFPLRGLTTYGGNGEELTERFLGVGSGGTGSLAVAGLNYSLESRQLAQKLGWAGPGPGPNLQFNLGAQYARIGTDAGGFDGKARYKYGADVLLQYFKYAGLAVRFDHVTPSSTDSGQTFSVLAPRLQFKTDWYSRETLQIMYAKWFFGPRTRNEGTGERSQEQLDDQLFALNLNMWW
jgi:hypothetical protein